MDQVVDIADVQVTDNPQNVLVTYSLGSCIGVVIWDPQIHVGGMLHYMLPESKLAPDKARERPAMFADTGLARLFRSAYELGAVKKRLVVKIAGGSQLLDDNDMFNIGKRNYTALRKVFWKNGILIDSEDIGGSIPRTMRLYVDSGLVTINNRTREVTL